MSERTSFRAPRAAHSEKPEAFYRIVERLYPLELWPESHVELFARRRRRGWISYGDELPPSNSYGGSWAATRKALEEDDRGLSERTERDEHEQRESELDLVNGVAST